MSFVLSPYSHAIALQPWVINADGWSATYPAPPTFDPVGNPQTFSVTRAGFDAAGNAASVTDTVTFMKRLRQPSPGQATLTADKVVLSDFIYQGNTIPGAANNSTRPAPKPIPMWLTRDLTRVTGDIVTLRLAVAHAHGRGGRPVAAVRFSVTDGTTTITQTVSTMSSRQWPGSGLYAPYFEANIDISTLNQGALCTADAEILPWAGAAFRISTDADAYPSANLSILKFLCDRTGAYGTAYAYVDATSGNNATGVVSQTKATAQASPYLTIAAAAAAIQTFNNTNFSRNSASGGHILLKPGIHNRTSFSSVVVTEVPLVIEADLVTNKASVIVSDGGVNVSNGLPAKTAWRNLTLRKAGGSITMFENNATLATMTNMVALENVNIDLNGQTDYAAWFLACGRMFLEDVTGGSAQMFDNFGTTGKHVQMVGCSGPWKGRGAHMICASRLTDAQLAPLAANTNIQASLGMYIGHSHLTTSSDATRAVNSTDTIGPRGMAIVYSVIEQTAGLSGPVLGINDNSINTPVENVLRIGLTVVGSRTNVLYNDAGTVAPSRVGYEIGCVNRGRNTKSDLFAPADGARVGNWPAVFQVGMRYNAIIQGGQDNVAPGTNGAWVGEVAALGSQYGTTAAPLAVAWVNDASFDGTGLGGGDYTPGPGSVLGAIPAAWVHYPIDLKGRVIPLDGTAVIGAAMKAVNVAPVLTIGALSGNVLNITASEACRLYWLVDDNATRTPAQIKAGGGYDAGSALLASGTADYAFSFPGTPAGSRYLHIVLEDTTTANMFSAASDIAFTMVIVAAPVLTGPTGTQTGATSGAGNVSTDVGDGTVYRVTTTSATAPTKAQVKAGQNHLGAAAVAAASQVVAAPGLQTMPAIAGLAASTTYYNHFMHERVAGATQSLVASSSAFTTTAGNPELLVDPGADFPAKWSASTNVAITGSRVVFSSPAAFASASTLSGNWAPVTGGVNYTLKVELVNLGTGGAAMFQIRVDLYKGATVGAGAATPGTIILTGGFVNMSATGVQTYTFTAPADATHCQLIVKCQNSGCTFELDNFSLKAT